MDALRSAPASIDLNPNEAAWQQFDQFVKDDPALVGNLIPDAWIAALAVTNNARVATADRGFARFTGLAWFNPVPNP